MSFILDALKKSEAERQRQSVPGLMDAGVGPRRRGMPAWALALAALLAVNVVILAVVLLRRTAPPPAVAANSVAIPANRAPGRATAGAAAGTAPVGGAESGNFSPMDPAPMYAPEIPVVGADEVGAGPQAPAAPAAPAGARRADAARRPDAGRDADPVLNGAAGRDDDEVLPSVSELNLQSLPELHLDVHVYATSAADRFVYINMRKYREGSVLQEGPTVERIRRDGVALSYQGVRFLLPRQ